MRRSMHHNYVFYLQKNKTSSISSPSTRVSSINQYDIGLIVNMPAAEVINSTSRLQEKIWFPPVDYQFPVSGPRNLKFQRSWLMKHKWLAYSSAQDGAFCKCCVLFGVREAGVNNQELRSFVTKPYTNWKKALENFTKHSLLEYHKTALLKSEMRSEIENQATLSIESQLSKQNFDFLNESRKHMQAIIETVILCGRQGLALRGSNDTGRIVPENPIHNDGNFRALLRYRASSDTVLKNHLENSPKNAMYISNRIQNELIDICHNLIKKQLIDRINNSKAFTIMADELADISGIEQISVCIRYINETNGTFKICEDFLSFVPTTQFTGEGIANAILDFLESSGIDCTYFFGQCYDGARAMNGEYHGAQAYIQKKYNLALYSHCAAHSFNLVVSYSCQVVQIRNCLGTIQSVYNFFNSPKRLLALQDAIARNDKLHEERKKKLKQSCTTRWVEQHESVAIYFHLQPAVIDALEVISSTWTDSKTSSGAFQLLTAIKTLDFQVSLQVLHSVHSLALSLSRMLQTENQDLIEAINLADATKDELINRRKNVEDNFSTIFKIVRKICEEYDIEVKKPRLASRQTKRCNVMTENTEDYYRISTYIPYLDLFVTHLEDRFLKHREILSNFGNLFPSKTTTLNEEACKKLFEKYTAVLNDDSSEVWISEVRLWRRRIADKNINTSLEALDICNKNAFPNVHKILLVMAVLPVTTATNERSFSTLRRLKNYLRSTMSENRLNGLASLNIHRDIEINVEAVLDEFFSVSRRVNLLKQ